ncbi:unnamed protein product [Arabis nemorensis]|uniref:Uncharacterized protein n=1 Tax=Arabis nemorensis TaxID=586526 RepID=A0A565CAK2_9BRAS|nr:unnamed protein product [Arabis nemorensis]
MLLGENLDLTGIKRYNRLRNTSSYFCITFDAYDPATREKVGFQVKVYEERIHPLNVTCTIARPKDKFEYDS